MKNGNYPAYIQKTNVTKNSGEQFMNKPKYMNIPPWDGKTEVSVIIPFNNEGSNIVFTAQAVNEELAGWCKYEILLIDNQSDWYMDCEVKNERMPLMKGKSRKFPIRCRAFFQGPPGSKRDGSVINTMFFRKGIMKYLQYDEKQGHWNAKNYGIRQSKGKYLLFLDAHCIPNRDGIRHLVEFLRNPPEEKIGGVHMYINYMLDSRSLEYRPQKDKFFGYCFCSAQREAYIDNGKRKIRMRPEPYKVCVMSTCGMMCPRSTIEELGGFHPEFGIYCGGEGYINLKQSTCGYHHWIHPKAICWHWAEKRGYQYWHNDFVRNEFIAAYINGGERALEFCIKGRGASQAIQNIADDVRDKCKEEHEFVKSRQVESLEQYFDRWIANPGVWEK